MSGKKRQLLGFAIIISLLVGSQATMATPTGTVYFDDTSHRYIFQATNNSHQPIKCSFNWRARRLQYELPRVTGRTELVVPAMQDSVPRQERYKLDVRVGNLVLESWSCK